MHYLETTFNNHIKQIGKQHDSAIYLKSVYGQQWDEFHTFGFIRNPWEWLVSMYNANLSDGAYGKEALPGGPGNHEMHRANLSFEDWIYHRKTMPMDWLSDHSGNLMVNEVRLFEEFIKNSRVCVGAKDHSRYQDWYTPESAAHVEMLGQREIEAGNYSF